MTIAVPRPARLDRQRRQAFGFPWLDHRTIGQVDEQAHLEYLHHTVGITPSQYCRLRELRCSEECAALPDRDSRGRFA